MKSKPNDGLGVLIDHLKRLTLENDALKRELARLEKLTATPALKVKRRRHAHHLHVVPGGRAD